MRRCVSARGRLALSGAGLALLVTGFTWWLLSRLLVRTGAHSIFGDIGKIFEPVGELAEEIAEGAEAAYHAIALVWKYLTESAGLLTSAWSWVVNGVDWMAGQVEGFAEETFHTISHILTHVIPEAAEWVYHHAVLWALHEIEKLAKKAWHWVQHAVRWAERELHKLRKLAEHWVSRLFKWAERAVWWVEHRAEWVWYLLTHPVKLAELLAGHLLAPLIRWTLHRGSHAVVTLLRAAAHEGSDMEHFFEDMIHDLL